MTSLSDRGVIRGAVLLRERDRPGLAGGDRPLQRHHGGGEHFRTRRTRSGCHLRIAVDVLVNRFATTAQALGRDTAQTMRLAEGRRDLLGAVLRLPTRLASRRHMSSGIRGSLGRRSRLTVTSSLAGDPG
jgi:hypothetical protein